MVKNCLETRSHIVEIEDYGKGDIFEPLKCTRFDSNTRAFVKIQDGCDMHCTYCVIPNARGHIRSKPIDEIVREAAVHISSGHREIILTGINLCCYGKDFCDGTRLVDAVETACGVQGIERVRLSSMEPEMLLDEDIERMSRLEKLCPQFHLSLQSGCDKTLKKMNRKYTCAQYKELCTKLRRAFHDCVITTDIMVGFAGETDEDFERTVEFVKEIGFEKVHIFPYSVRKGTAAEKFEQQLPNQIKEQRAQHLGKVCSRIRRDFLVSNIGKRVKVLFEKEKGDGFHRGYTMNYTPVVVKQEQDRSWRWQTKTVTITGVEGDHCIAQED
jgi:threonylcarbamoyladenosine tRNA methylthiotransferase MtaB